MLQELPCMTGWRWGARPIFGYRWAAEGLKPWPCLGQKILKMHTLFRTTPSILVPCLGQRTKCRPCCLKVIYWQLQLRKSCYSHCFLKVQTHFIKHQAPSLISWSCKWHTKYLQTFALDEVDRAWNTLFIIRTDSHKSSTLFRTDLREIMYPV